MKHRTLSLRVLGLSIMAVLAFGAFSASGAQAATWIHGSTAFTSGQEAEVEPAGLEGLDTLTLLRTSTNVAVLCHLVHLVEVVLLYPDTVHGLLVFSMCEAGTSTGAGNFTPNTLCEVESVEASVKGLGLSTPAVLFEPAEGETFTTIHIKTSQAAEEEEEECLIAGNVPVKGSVLANVTNNETVEPTLTATNTDELKFGANNAELIGAIKVRYATNFVGQALGVL